MTKLLLSGFRSYNSIYVNLIAKGVAIICGLPKFIYKHFYY